VPAQIPAVCHQSLFVGDIRRKFSAGQSKQKQINNPLYKKKPAGRNVRIIALYLPPVKSKI